MKYWTPINFPRKGTLKDIVNFNVTIVLYIILVLHFMHYVILNSDGNIDIRYYYIMIGTMIIHLNTKSIINDLSHFEISLALIMATFFIVVNDYGLLTFVIANNLMNYSYYKNNASYFLIAVYIIYVLYDLKYSLVVLSVLNCIVQMYGKYLMDDNLTKYTTNYMYKEIEKYWCVKYVYNKLLLKNFQIPSINGNVNTYYLTEKNKKTFKIINKIGIMNYKSIISLNVIMVLLLTIIYKKIMPIV